ncbi:MAG: carbohydrate kinase [Candidatus Azobacteroides sp.]|nr:carbohydrate kinase [Candidatus Azobacteroides sp.]
MRKVIGVGESILDILFENNVPVKAVPGGSVFNGMISLSRMKIETSFISEVGEDRAGKIILDFMEENGMDTTYVSSFPDGTTAVSLAFLDEKANAEYVFYRNYPAQRLDGLLPLIQPDDIFIFGSYYALNPVLRPQMLEMLTYARERKAIIYYDPNFRSSHIHEAMKLQATIIENLEFADIVRGSKEDFINLYGMHSANEVYEEKIRFFTNHFIYTKGEEGVTLKTNSLSKEYPADTSIRPLSTVGAGDNFNAGILYGIIKQDVSKEQLDHLPEEKWNRIIEHGIRFSAEACKRLDNSIPADFCNKLG